MRMIINLVFLAAGFLGGIYVGVHYQDKAVQIDQIRADQQAKIGPQLQAAAARAKIEVLSRLQGSHPAAAPTAPAGNSLAGNGAPADKTINVQQELEKAHADLKGAEAQLASDK